MKRYSLLIISFFISIIIFIILIVIQRNITNQDNLVRAYIFNQDIDMHSKIIPDLFDEIYVDSNVIEKYNCITNLEDGLNMYSKYNIKKGDLLNKDILVNIEEIEYINENSDMENIALKLDNTSIIYSNFLKDKSSINLYVTVNENYLPDDIENYSRESFFKDQNNVVTFLYIQNIKPIKLLDENGYPIGEQGKFSSMILSVNKKQSMYLNSIINNANFKITIK